MSMHRPKTAALIAYTRELLSPVGRARLQSHLAGCEVCQRELAAIAAYELTLDETRRHEGPELDFDHMELVLGREAQRISREIQVKKRARPQIWIGLALAAALLLALLIGSWRGNAPPVAERATPANDETPDETEATALEARVTLTAGESFHRGSRAPLQVGELLREGASIATGEDGLAHVSVDGSTGFVAAASSEIELTRMRSDRIALTLARGRIDNTVEAFRWTSAYVVLCAGYEVEVRGTRFTVSYVTNVLGVDVAQGTVLVRTPDGQEIELAAPARWRSSGSAEAGEPDVSAARQAIDDATLLTLSHPELARWEVDGTSVESTGPVRLAMRSGEHQVRGWDLRGRLYTALVAIGREPVTLSPTELTPEPPVERPGHLAPEEIQPVLARGQRSLALCYERALRIHPEVQGRLRLRITIGHLGEVRRVRVLGADGSDTAEMRECISSYASRWTFPPPGGPVTFEVPLNFTSRMNAP